MMNVKIVLDSGAKIPVKKHPEDAGYDICSNEKVVLHPMERKAVGTGIRIEPEPNWYVQVVPRSGLAIKNGISVLNTPGTIDSNYRNEIKVILINLSNEDFEINVGDRIAQLIFTPSYSVDFENVLLLGESDRNLGGFGSTGIK
jgi:dUTP pyrophosphatase